MSYLSIISGSQKSTERCATSFSYFYFRAFVIGGLQLAHGAYDCFGVRAVAVAGGVCRHDRQTLYPSRPHAFFHVVLGASVGTTLGNMARTRIERLVLGASVGQLGEQF